MATLVLPYPPSANRLWTFTARGARLTEAAKAYKTECGLVARTQATADMPFLGAVRLTMRFYRPRKAGDLDNMQKGLLDALNGICWHDDRQIVELHAYRHDDKRNPRVEVEITEVD